MHERKTSDPATSSLFIEPKDNTGVCRVGTSGWSYPPGSGPGSWTGVFYPLSKKIDELKFYSRFFNTVEVNSTFYRPCAAKTAESWAKRTPDDFEFTVKVWQQFTHKTEEWTPEEIAEFKQGIRPLMEANKLGCILFQFPASFKHTPEAMDRLKALLEKFEDYPKATELRHRSWEDILPLLGSLNTVPAFIDEPKFKDSIRQDLAAASGSTLYLRLHGRKFDKWWRHDHRNERYDYLYTREELRPYAVRLKSVIENQDVQRAYIFFNNHPAAKAVANAVMMRAQLDIPVRAELPESLVQAYPELTKDSVDGN
jgi:uncharacterized protein YecE (DUF72 family)